MSESLNTPKDRIIIAFDEIMGRPQLQNVLEDLSPFASTAKFHNYFAKRLGDWKHTSLQANVFGFRTMADDKWFDNPQIVKQEVYDQAVAGASLITVHAGSTKTMMQAAIEGRDKARSNKTELGRTFRDRSPELIGKVLGATVLTSIDNNECMSIYGDHSDKKVERFALKAYDAGLDGVVCSPHEVKIIRKHSELDNLIVVTPGISAEWARQSADQRRTAKARLALETGADYIVAGSVIMNPPDGMTRVEAAQRMLQEVTEAL